MAYDPILKSKRVILTSAQIKAIHATPIEILPAPGSGKGYFVVGCAAKFVYGGSNVFIAALGESIGLYYNNTVTSLIAGNAFITNSAITSNENLFMLGFQNNFGDQSPNVAGVLDNVNITAYNAAATEITGNIANNNTIDITVYYSIINF
jgi:hypothetical protein